MRIAIIQPRVSYYNGGGEKITLKFIMELVKRNNIIIDLFTIKPIVAESEIFKRFKQEISQNVNIIELIVPDKFKYLYLYSSRNDQSRWDAESLFFNNLVYPFLEKCKPDLIWCNYIIDCLVKPLHIPSILYLVGYPRNYISIRKAWIDQYDTIICISKNVKSQWNYLTNNKLQNSKILYTAPIFFEDKQKNTKKIFSKLGFNILYVGRLIERKGVKTLIEAIKHLKKKIPNINLYILGSGPYEVGLKKLAKRYNLKIYFLGHKDNLSKYYKNASICVFPSYKGEGLMGVVLEALSCGAGVITTTNNGNEELINNGINGILVEPKNYKQLANAIFFAYENPKKIKKMGNLAKRKINKNFTWSKHITRFNKIINNLLKNPNVNN